MNIVFIDTSVLCNLLDIPRKNESRQMVIQEFKKFISMNAKMILPIATIIETGNHIAHIGPSYERERCAEKFANYLKNTAEGKAPWVLYGNELTEKDLLYLSEHCLEYARQKIGIGDLSILYQFQSYMRMFPTKQLENAYLWSLDEHLKHYSILKNHVF